MNQTFLLVCYRNLHCIFLPTYIRNGTGSLKLIRRQFDLANKLLLLNSVVDFLEESPCPQGSLRTNLQVLVPSIFNRLRAIARYWSEIATFSYPTLYLMPPLGCSHWNSGKKFNGPQKTRIIGLRGSEDSLTIG